VLVATSKRVIFASKILLSTKIEELYYDKISNVQYESGLLFAEIEISVSRSKYEFKDIDKKYGKELCDYIKSEISKPKAQQTVVNQTIVNQADPMDQLEKLAKLKDQGIITEEEFSQKKKQLLGL
jgi:hypothetical protein